MTYTMRTPNSCGPDALVYASGASYDAIDQAFECPDITRFRNSMDSPLDHRVACSRLGLPMRVVTPDEIIAENLRAVVLFHGKGTLASFTSQHWAVVETAGLGGVHVSWGDGTTKYFTCDAFRDAYERGAPEYAYVVGQGQVPRLPLWKLVLRRVCRWIGY